MVRCLAVMLGVAASWSAPAPVHAQAPEQRHPSALFGAPDPRLSGEAPDGGLFLGASLFGAYDDSLRPDQGLTPASQGDSRSRGTYAGFGGRLMYERPTEQGWLRASVESAGRYYRGTEQFMLGRQVADLSSSTVLSLWRGAQLQATGMATYAWNGGPFTNATFGSDYSPFVLFDRNDASELRRSDLVRGQAQVRQDWGPRKSVTALAGVYTSAVEDSARAEGYELGGTFDSKIARYGALRAGYTLQEISHGGGNYLVHNIDAGANYDHPVSASRRAFFSLSGGSALLEGTTGQVRMRAIADAGLRYEFGRSWNGSARYHRGIAFIDEISDPLSSDGVVGEVTGLLSRRLEWLGSGSVMRGTTLSAIATPYDVYTARTQLRYAISRVAAVYGEYLLLHYDFADFVHLGGNLPTDFDRRTLRVGVTILTQLLH